MSFNAGRVSFCRFRVVGDAPQSVDEVTLGTLGDHQFRESSLPTPEVIEAGFISGSHIFDTEFSYEANAFGDPPGSLLLCAMRYDTHNVPAEVKFGYRKQEELAAAASNPSGFASKNQKREAKDAADRQIQEDLASGKYRQSRSVPLLWDFAKQELYVGATAQKAIEQLSKLMYEAFNVRLETISPGTLAEQAFGANHRDFEDLQPSRFTPPPAETTSDSGDSATPVTPWVKGTASTRDFLGNEFLFWLWWSSEQGEKTMEVPRFKAEFGGVNGHHDHIAFVLDQALDMDCAWDITGKQTLRGPKPTLSPEAAKALQTGKWPRKAGMILADADDQTQWELTLQADRWVISSAKLPQDDDAETPREIIETRLARITDLSNALDGLYYVFLKQRTNGWATHREQISEWIKTRKN